MTGMTQRMARLLGKAKEIAGVSAAMSERGMTAADEEMPADVLERLWEAGFMSLFVPREFEGMGAGFLEAARVIEALSEGSASTGLVVLLQCLGTLPILQYGDEVQKEKWLKKIVHERKLLAFALSEPGVFGEEKVTETRAEKKDKGYMINGQKVFVSRGADADLVVVFAVTDPKAGLDKGLSAFLVEKGAPGFMLAGEATRSGMRYVPWSNLRFEGCKVSQDQMIGKKSQGYQMAARALLEAGPLLGAAAAGGMHSAIRFCSKMIREQGQEWQAMDEFQPVEVSLADMAVGLETSRSIVYRAAEALDESAAEYSRLSKIAKSYATDTAVSVVEKGIEMFGNYGVLNDFPLKRMLDEAIALKGMLGANTLHRAAIVRDVLKDNQVGGSSRV
jgi:alkylation response protein AidB-like acyl-CoA dehydrogenase